MLRLLYCGFFALFLNISLLFGQNKDFGAKQIESNLRLNYDQIKKYVEGLRPEDGIQFSKPEIIRITRRKGIEDVIFLFMGSKINRYHYSWEGKLNPSLTNPTDFGLQSKIRIENIKKFLIQDDIPIKDIIEICNKADLVLKEISSFEERHGNFINNKELYLKYDEKRRRFYTLFTDYFEKWCKKNGNKFGGILEFYVSHGSIPKNGDPLPYDNEGGQAAGAGFGKSDFVFKSNQKMQLQMMTWGQYKLYITHNTPIKNYYWGVDEQVQFDKPLYLNFDLETKYLLKAGNGIKTRIEPFYFDGTKKTIFLDEYLNK